MHLRQSRPSESSQPGETRDDPDAALVAAARVDPAAYEPIVARYSGPLLNYCFYRLGSWEEAEDAAQDVLTRAYLALPRFQPETALAFRSWLFTIAHHEVLNRRRGWGIRARHTIEAGEMLIDPGPGPEEIALAADRQGRILALLAHLSADQRQVVSLRLAGLTGAEIGAVLGRQPGAIRAIQARAIARLRDLLGVDTANGAQFDDR